MARDDEFAAFAAARYRALVRTGLLMTGDSGRAEDLAQSALIRTYLARSRLREPANVGAFARRTLMRLAFRARQRRWNAEIATGRVGQNGAVPAVLRLGRNRAQSRRGAARGAVSLSEEG